MRGVGWLGRKILNSRWYIRDDAWWSWFTRKSLKTQAAIVLGAFWGFLAFWMMLPLVLRPERSANDVAGLIVLPIWMGGGSFILVKLMWGRWGRRPPQRPGEQQR
jgi:hypothetical protein